MRARLAAVQDVLLVFDLEVLPTRFNYRPVCIGSRQTFVQIGMIGVILQFSCYFKGCSFGSGSKIGPEKLGQPQVGIF